jgi:hypothetical protein
MKGFPSNSARKLCTVLEMKLRFLFPIQQSYLTPLEAASSALLNACSRLLTMFLLESNSKQYHIGGKGYH